MFLKRASLVGLGIFLALILLDFFFHFVTPRYLQGLVRELLGEKLTDCQKKDSVLHHALLSNCLGEIKTRDYIIPFKTNSLGLRNREVSISKPENNFRVLIIGDSFVEGWGVTDSERFDAIAQNLIKTQTSKNVEIINAGTRSYSPILELEFLRMTGVKLNPDMVIMFFDVSDLHDDFYYGGWKRHKKIREEIFPGREDYIVSWPEDDDQKLIQILKKSTLFSNLYHQLGTLILNKEKRLSTTNLSWDISLFAKAEDWEDFDKVWNLNIANILLINDYLKKKGIKFFISVVPRGIYTSETEWQAGRKPLGIEVGRVYQPKPIIIIEKAVKEKQIPVIDLLVPLSQSGDSSLYYSFDGHWTKNAHRIVGEIIAKSIEKFIQNEQN